MSLVQHRSMHAVVCIEAADNGNAERPHNSEPILDPVQVEVPADEVKRLHVFIAHAGEQKKAFVDLMRVLLQVVYKLRVFVDEWSLQPDDDSLPVIQQHLAAAAVGETATHLKSLCTIT